MAQNPPNSRATGYLDDPAKDPTCIFQTMVPQSEKSQKQAVRRGLPPIDYDVRLKSNGEGTCTCPGYGWRYRSQGMNACWHLKEAIQRFQTGGEGWRREGVPPIWPPIAAEVLNLPQGPEVSVDEMWRQFNDSKQWVNDNFGAKFRTERED
jgi:hypothetical protein